jgi:glycosyltransferase involved in cell wall biosynthesis
VSANLDSQKLAVVIPVYNEGGRLRGVVLRLAEKLAQLPGEPHIIVVDDGSSRAVSLEDVTVGREAPVSVHLLRHSINLGQGAALQTGVEFARDVVRADVFATMDADGQHNPADLPAMLAALENLDIVFGTRFVGAGAAHVPPARRVLLKGARLFERVLTRLDLSDAHNGYRVFNRRFAEVLLLRQNRMAHATEVKQTVARHGLRYGEVPVIITYSDETMAKGQRNTGSFVILRDLLRAYLFNG